jgi:hypothetical protein
MFKLLTFKVIIDKVGLMSTIFINVLSLPLFIYFLHFLLFFWF